MSDDKPSARDLVHAAIRAASARGCCNLPACAFPEKGRATSGGETMLCDELVAMLERDRAERAGTVTVPAFRCNNCGRTQFGEPAVGAGTGATRLRDVPGLVERMQRRCMAGVVEVLDDIDAHLQKAMPAAPAPRCSACHASHGVDPCVSSCPCFDGDVPGVLDEPPAPAVVPGQVWRAAGGDRVRITAIDLPGDYSVRTRTVGSEHLGDFTPDGLRKFYTLESTEPAPAPLRDWARGKKP